MKLFKSALTLAVAAVTSVGGWAAPLVGAAALLAGPVARAQPGCTYHVGDSGHGDWVDCSQPTPSRPPQPVAPDVWGAVAATPNGGWGTSWNYISEKGASDAALQNCRRHAGANAGCRVLKTVADFCVALVASTQDRMTFVGGPIAAGNFAADNAQLQCQRAGGRSCRLETTVCADGRPHVLRGRTAFSNGNPIFIPDGGGAFGRR